MCIILMPKGKMHIYMYSLYYPLNAQFTFHRRHQMGLMLLMRKHSDMRSQHANKNPNLQKNINTKRKKKKHIQVFTKLVQILLHWIKYTSSASWHHSQVKQIQNAKDANIIAHNNIPFCKWDTEECNFRFYLQFEMLDINSKMCACVCVRTL